MNTSVLKSDISVLDASRDMDISSLLDNVFQDYFGASRYDPFEDALSRVQNLPRTVLKARLRAQMDERTSMSKIQFLEERLTEGKELQKSLGFHLNALKKDIANVLRSIEEQQHIWDDLCNKKTALAEEELSLEMKRSEFALRLSQNRIVMLSAKCDLKVNPALQLQENGEISYKIQDIVFIMQIAMESNL
uniref:CENP-H domain-containing protein n=1 Tax=Heterorhabditis bacteriophora TaxID=37862 RepID=A0A1I7XJB7_HETBA